MFISKKNAIAAGALSLAALVLVAIIATNLIKGHRKKVEDQRISELVAEGTAQLRDALAKPSNAVVAKLDGYVRTAQSSPSPEVGSAAEAYLLGARGIARQRADGERLEREGAAARAALARHMARAERRNTNWIRQAADLKRSVEASYAELDRSLKTLDSLLGNLPDATRRLAPNVAPGALIEQGEIDAARKRAQEDSARAVAELEQVRRIGF